MGKPPKINRINFREERSKDMLEMQKVYSSDDVRRVADYHNNFYFSPATMRCFNSRLLDGFWPTDDTWTQGYVVVSNHPDPDLGPRTYDVVEFTQFPKENGHMTCDLNHLVVEGERITFFTAQAAKNYATFHSSLRRGIAQAAKGDVVDMGSFQE